jgi:anti-sigma factor ChrR (cupin superfamily)
MEINADFSQPAFAHTEEIEWVPSPMAGVDRRMLDRIGGEVARATSIVRYANGSSFPEHTHSGGEEFIVLEGTFQDEHGDYPAGTYVRNPVGTHHVPASEEGCTIFVKLWQFDPGDQEQVVIDLNKIDLPPHPGRRGVSHAVLAKREYENVALEQWQSDAKVAIRAEGGFEALVLSGSVIYESEAYTKHDWLRFPDGMTIELTAGEDGARLWIKRGHLADIRIPEQA